MSENLEQVNNTTDATAVAAGSENVNGSSVKRGRRKTRIGKVVSNKMDKSIIVAIERRISHPKNISRRRPSLWLMTRITLLTLVI